MKVKAKKAHYWESKYVFEGQTYICDRVHGESVVRRGICVELSLPKRADKVKAVKENKMQPKKKITRKKK